MAKNNQPGSLKSNKKAKKPPSLKELAQHLELSTTTVSLVLNNSRGASSIPQETQERIFAAAEKLNYRPNYFARSLRAQRSYTFGVIVPELSDGFSAMVLGGVESVLTRHNYSYFTTTHLHRDDLLIRNPQMLIDREVEAIIALDTPIRFDAKIPVVCVSGHEEIEGVMNIVLDHKSAAEMGIAHFVGLGHKKIALIKGQTFSSDTAIRWETITKAAEAHGVPIDPNLVVQLEGESPTPEPGYVATKELIAGGCEFTALFAFNDMSAIGAIRALREEGLEVPRDISVMGFDDIHAAAFHNPALTTIRQPLFEMGKLSAKTLLKRVNGKWTGEIPKTLTVEPELIVRDSTGSVSSK
ncbi:MAG: LacI family DNA-binding transcriptional regulator [Pyrinomonadaceae bacterium]